MIQIYLISHKTGAIKNVLPPQKLVNFNATRRLNDIGKVAFTFYNEDSFFNSIELDDYIEVYTINSDGSTELFSTYFVRLTKLIIENNINYYGVGGVSLNHLITRRILDVETDTNALGGYVTLADFGGNLLETLADEHMISSTDASRNFPFLSITKDAVGTIQAGIRKRYDNLFEIFKEITDRTDIDFEIRRDGVDANSLVLHIEHIGTDKTKQANYPTSEYVKLTPKQRTLKSATLEIDNTNETNFVYLLGEGDELNQQIVKYPASTTGSSLFNRIEFTKTARNQKSDFVNVTQQLTEAIKLLKEGQAVINLDYTLPENINITNIEFGDRLNVVWENHNIRVRLSEIEISVNNGNQFDRKFKLEKFDI